MKRIFSLVVLLLLVLSLNAGATNWGDTNNYYDNDYNITNQGGQGGQGGNADADAHAAAIAAAAAKASAAAMAVTMQGQMQNTVLDLNNSQVIKPVQEVNIEVQRPVIDTPQANVTPYPILQNGKINEYPKMPNFGAMELKSGELIASVRTVTWFWDMKSFLFFSYIHMKDVEPLLVNLYNDAEDKIKFRFKVLGPDGTQGYGFGLANSTAVAEQRGLINSTGYIGAGINRSDYDPLYTIWIYEIK